VIAERLTCARGPLAFTNDFRLVEGDVDIITSLLAPIGSVTGAIGGTYTVANILIEHIGKR
jgi:hypothetical protein